MILFDEFPYLENNKIIIRKMDTNDIVALSQISNNKNVYKYLSPFLQNKSEKFLKTAIENLGRRDFEKRKMIIAGIYLKSNPDRLVGLAEMFDYKKKERKITIGYRINELYWNQKVATNALGLMVNYLLEQAGLKILMAFVIPENVYSAKALLNNGFVKESYTAEETNWGGQEALTVDVYTRC